MIPIAVACVTTAEAASSSLSQGVRVAKDAKVEKTIFTKENCYECLPEMSRFMVSRWEQRDESRRKSPCGESVGILFR
jgi:hypothetical protein